MISIKDFSYINRAIQASTKSTMLMKHGCVIVENNKIVGSGYNSYRTQFGDKFIKKSCSCHAEIHALREVMKIKMKKHNKSQSHYHTIKVAKVAV